MSYLLVVHKVYCKYQKEDVSAEKVPSSGVILLFIGLLLLLSFEVKLILNLLYSAE